MAKKKKAFTQADVIRLLQRLERSSTRRRPLTQEQVDELNRQNEHDPGRQIFRSRPLTAEQLFRPLGY